MLTTLFNKALDLVRNKDSRSFLAILLANVINNITAFVISVMAMKMLPEEQYAQFGFSLSITLVTTFFADFGLSITLVRMYNTAKDDTTRHWIVAVNILWKTFLFLLILFIGYPVQQYILLPIYPLFEGSGNLIFIALVSGTLMSYWTVVRALEQAKSHFISYTVYTLCYAAFRIAVFAAVLYLKITSPSVYLLSIYGVPLLFLCTSTVLFNKENRQVFLNIASYFTKEVYEKVIKKSLSYGFWVAVATVCYALLLQIPQFIMGKVSTKEMVALYSAGLTFVAIFELINTSLTTVILPGVTSIKTDEGRANYKRKLLQKGPLFFTLGILGIISISLFQLFILGDKYSSSIHIFIILSIGSMITIYIGLFNTLLHSFGVPKIGALINLGRAVSLVGILILFKLTHVIHVSLAYVLVTTLGELTVYLFLLRYERKIKARASC